MTHDEVARTRRREKFREFLCVAFLTGEAGKAREANVGCEPGRAGARGRNPALSAATVSAFARAPRRRNTRKSESPGSRASGR